MIERIDALNAKVTDLLVYARPMEPKLQPVNVRPLIADAASSALVASRMAAPPIEITGDSVVVRADADMLRPVLLNLLLNAYQASGDPPIEVDVSQHGGHCTIRVLDRGPGIPPAVRAHMFEPFYTTKPEGTGLGLSVVKRLMDMQGGSVRLTDREKGARQPN